MAPVAAAPGASNARKPAGQRRVSVAGETVNLPARPLERPGHGIPLGHAQDHLRYDGLIVVVTPSGKPNGFSPLRQCSAATRNLSQVHSSAGLVGCSPAGYMDKMSMRRAA